MSQMLHTSNFGKFDNFISFLFFYTHASNASERHLDCKNEQTAKEGNDFALKVKD